MMRMPMVNLAKSPSEAKTDMVQPMAIPASKPSAPEYPYGCCISLDDDTLTKLGLDGDMPKGGEMIHFCGMAKVTCASVRDEVDASGASTQCRRVELQITDMGVLSADPVDHEMDRSAARRKRFYGDSEPDGDED